MLQVLWLLTVPITLALVHWPVTVPIVWARGAWPTRALALAPIASHPR